jgi:putative peptidoglycan lipid II flippase
MNLHKALVTVSGMTMLSRITGLLREQLIAAMFGASAQTDAFMVAFRIPNLLRRVFAEGALSLRNTRKSAASTAQNRWSTTSPPC